MMSLLYKVTILCLLAFLLFAHHTKLKHGRTEPVVAESAYKAFKSGQLNPNAPPETTHLGQLAGVWQATQTSRNRDGSWSDTETKADWIWYYILDGHAVQDDWIMPPLDVNNKDSNRFYGTNIRIFNTKKKLWEMAWIDNRGQKVLTFEATSDTHKTVMTGYDGQGQLSRNTFYNITEQSFDWEKEWTMDDGKTWFAVARIHCERKR